MARDPEETYDFLARTYRVAKLVALSVISFVGLLLSTAALNLELSNRWTSVRIPLYSVTIGALLMLVILGVPLIVAVILLRDSIRTSSFYRSKALHLESAVTGLEELAYTDAITGIPNSNALERELTRTSGSPLRCLILLDLQNFGSINKRYNHWAGDEYLRQFANMVVKSGRRNEYIYKLRPKEPFTPGGELGVMGGNDPKAFRKNQGSDEFFMLLEGSIIDGLGYLNRLMRRASEFEDMSRAVLGEVHPFGFHAGVTNVARNEPYNSVIMRASQCLAVAREPQSPLYVKWSPGLPEFDGDTFPAKILAETEHQFKKST